MDNHRTIYTEVDEEITSIIERVKKTPVEEIALVVPRRSFLSQSIVNLKLLKNQSEKYGKKILLVTRDSLCRSLAEKVGLETSKKLDSETLQKTEIDTLMPRAHQPRNLAIIPNQSINSRQTIPVHRENGFETTKDVVRITEIKSPVPVPQPMVPQSPNSLDMVKPDSLKQARSEPIEAEDDDEMIPEKIDEHAISTNAKINFKDFFKAVLGKKTPEKEIEPEKEDLPGATGAFDQNESREPAFAKIEVQSEAPANDDVLEEEEPLPSGKNADGLQSRGFIRDVGLPSKPSLNVIDKGKSKKIILLPKASSRLFVGFLAVLFFVAFLTGVFVLPKGEISITPKKELVVANIEVSASPLEKDVDASKQLIPLSDLQETLREEKEFQATGTARGGNESRVSGTLTVYNEFSSSTETFVTHTRFMTEGGLVFRSATPVKIPGYTKSGGAIVPGQATIEVLADGGGEEYLIEKQKLNVPGLSGGDRYGKIYAMADAPMKKPSVAGTKIVTLADIRTAKTEMQKYMQELAKNKLAEENKGVEIASETIIFENFKAEPTLSVGASADAFKLKGEITIHGKGYKLEDLKKVADAYLAERAQKNIVLVSKADVKVESSELLKDGKTTNIKLYAERQGVKKMDPEDFKSGALGLTAAEAKDKLTMMESVQEAEISLWPFWVKSVPTDASKVSVTVKY